MTRASFLRSLLPGFAGLLGGLSVPFASVVEFFERLAYSRYYVDPEPPAISAEVSLDEVTEIWNGVQKTMMLSLEHTAPDFEWLNVLDRAEEQWTVGDEVEEAE